MPILSQKILSLLFILAGAFHFIRPSFYLQIMPPYVPEPLAMIYVSGFFEILFGALFLFSKTRPAAAAGLVLLLLAVFPANVHLAIHPEIFPSIPAWAHWARLPLQGVFIAWVLIAK